MTWFYVSRSEPASLSLLGLLRRRGLRVLILFFEPSGGAGDRRVPLRGGDPFLLLAGAPRSSPAALGADRSDIRRDPHRDAEIAHEPLDRARDELEGFGSGRGSRRSSTFASFGRSIAPGDTFPAPTGLRSFRQGRVHAGRRGPPALTGDRDHAEPERSGGSGDGIDPGLRGLDPHRLLRRLYPLVALPAPDAGHHYYKATDPWPKTLIYDLLKPAGYATALVAAENLSWGKMDAFLRTPNLELFFDAETSGMSGRVDSGDDGIAREVREGVLSTEFSTTDRPWTWRFLDSKAGRGGSPFLSRSRSAEPALPLSAAGRNRDAFSAVHDRLRRFLRPLPLQEDGRRPERLLQRASRSGPATGAGRYALEPRGRSKIVLVVYGDHGEAFHENGQVTHAAQPIEVVARVPCIIVAPRYLEPRTDDYPAQLIDLPPIVLSLIGWPSHPNFQGIDLLAADRPARERRALFIHTENPLSHTDAVILEGAGSTPAIAGRRRKPSTTWRRTRVRCGTSREGGFEDGDPLRSARRVEASPACVLRLSRFLRALLSPAAPAGLAPELAMRRAGRFRVQFENILET